MALIEVSYCLLNNAEMFDIIVDSFDKIEEVKDDPYYKKKTLRVTHPEVPKEDVIICPEFYSFNGVRPFIISFEL